MGFILYTCWPMKAKAKSPTLIQNCHGLAWGVLKFSSFMSRREAAASRPTTAGRSPISAWPMEALSLYYMKNLLMASMRMKLGRTTAKVAMKLPRMPQ